MSAPPKPAVPVACAFACIVIASISLLGWTLGIDRLTSVFPGLPRLVPMTASLILLGSASICCLATRHPKAGTVLAAVTAAGAMLVLGLHLSGHVPAPLTFADDRPNPFSLSSPITAGMFLAAGAGLLCTANKRTLRWGQSIALGLLLLALLTAAGYIFRDTFLYQLLPGRGTSIMTALAFCLMALGVLALRPAEGIMVVLHGPGPAAWATRRLLLSALAVPVLLGALAALTLRADAIDAGTAIAFLVWGVVALFTAVVWRFALVLQRYDAARRQAERERETALAALREADVRKDDFMALLAHELRNPLAPIRAAAEFLKLGNCDPAQLRRTSDIIRRQTDYMVHLVEDLLDVSRVRRGLIALDKVPVDLVDVVNDAVEQVKPQMARRHHRLDVALPDQHPSVLGDHKRLVQVVANLLGNAAKYTPEGGHVRLALRADDNRIEVEVRDDGIGIDSALLPHVFESFTQGTRTAGRAEGGLGLGLALVKRLAELHGGDVTAHSAGSGQGSVFVLTLPRMQGLPEGAPAARGAASLPLRP
nr:HAMP domain-containing sensor histidine kinase [uncultured Massilia sp.]